MRTPSAPYGNRVKATDWLTTGHQHLVVGVPGSGKSALLRTLVLDILAEEPRLIGQVDRLHGVLPVWLPFSFWTNAARKNTRSVSVLDAVHDWLKAYDHGHLWPLIEKVLRDERVLLVVDGLDEWASPDLARICVDRLEVFARTKHAGVLASSRPFSPAELPVDTPRWRLAPLAPLDHDQRLSFVRKWLTPLVEQRTLKKEAADWTSEIESSAHLRELADLPLFLLLLLRGREQQAEFPEDLHAVLGDAVNRLIGEHRRRKIDISGAADQFPSPGDIRKVSAATAEYMHTASMLAISDDELREVFRRTLADSVGYPDAEAHAMAVALVKSLSPGVGLMVRPAPDEARFFHRSVLEFLAAERLLTHRADEQVALVRDHLTNPRWSQVLRFLIRGIVRPPEIRSIFDVLDAAGADNALLREAADLLAADVAVGAGHADARTRRRLLSRVVAEIETGERERHRAQLLDRLVAGLSRREIRADLAQRFGVWLRGISPEAWSSALRAASSWEPDDTLLAMLWHALLDEDDEVHRTAGRMLGTKFAGRDDVAGRLAELASTTRLYPRRAAATEALSLGWPNHAALDTLIPTGREHSDFAVRHASVAADLRRGNATDANRSLLIDLLDQAIDVMTWSGGLMQLMFESWYSGLLELMLKHYPDDQSIFDHYVHKADPTANDQYRFGDKVTSMFLILKGYARRPEARQYFLKFISPERWEFPESPRLLTDLIPWTKIAETHSEDTEVVAAVEGLIREHLSSSIGNRDVYFCSLVARTNWVRDRLIARIRSEDTWGIGWTIRALIEGWPHDASVRQALTELVSPAASVVPDGAIAHLGAIITDPEAAMGRLAELAVGCSDQGVVVAALNDIVERGGSRDDPRAKAIVERALDHDLAIAWPSPESALYAGFPDDPRVRELALSRLSDRDAPTGAIVYGFRGDPEFRQAIAARFAPLSPPLRGRLVKALTETPATDATATALLARYDAEPDPSVKILTAAAYARRLVATDAVTDEIIDMFTEQARAVGNDAGERRAAAFCALAELGLLDRLTDLRESHGPDTPVRIEHLYFGAQELFSRYVCRHWDDIRSALGNEFQYRFGTRGGSDSEFWRNILAVAHDYPATRDDITLKLTQDPELAHSAEAVGYLSRTEPGSDRLWDATVAVLDGVSAGSDPEIQSAWTALHVLAEQFADDPRTEAWLDAALVRTEGVVTVYEDGQTYVDLPSLGILAAAARSRPHHPLLLRLLTEATRPAGGPWRTFHEWAELAVGTVTDPRQFIDLAVEISRIGRINDMPPEHVHGPLVARLRRDETLAAAVAGLAPGLSGAAFGIVVRVLALGERLGSHLVDHLRSRVTSKSGDEPTETFDPLSGQPCHIQLLILEILDTAVS